MINPSKKRIVSHLFFSSSKYPPLNQIISSKLRSLTATSRPKWTSWTTWSTTYSLTRFVSSLAMSGPIEFEHSRGPWYRCVVQRDVYVLGHFMSLKLHKSIPYQKLSPHICLTYQQEFLSSCLLSASLETQMRSKSSVNNLIESLHPRRDWKCSSHPSKVRCLRSIAS